MDEAQAEEMLSLLRCLVEETTAVRAHMEQLTIRSLPMLDRADALMNSPLGRMATRRAAKNGRTEIPNPFDPMGVSHAG